MKLTQLLIFCAIIPAVPYCVPYTSASTQLANGAHADHVPGGASRLGVPAQSIQRRAQEHQGFERAAWPSSVGMVPALSSANSSHIGSRQYTSSAIEVQPDSGTIPPRSNPATISTGMLWAGRICLAESELRLNDCAAELHVGRKRAARNGTAWHEALRAYSSLERSRGKRARRIRAMRWEQLPKVLRQTVIAFDRGELPDPCPSAFGWGGKMDSRRRGQIVVRCEIRMVNWYYKTEARKG